jgi:hypothetical protein
VTHTTTMELSAKMDPLEPAYTKQTKFSKLVPAGSYRPALCACFVNLEGVGIHEADI